LEWAPAAQRARACAAKACAWVAWSVWVSVEPSELERDELSARVARITSALQAQAQRLADGMVEQIAAQIAAFSLDEQADVRADVRANCVASNRLFLDVAASGRTVEPAELLPFMPKPQWIRAGASLEDVLRAFRVGHIYMWDAILTEARRGETGTDAALELARRSMDYMDLVSSAVAHAYLGAQQSIIADRDRSRSNLLGAVLDGHLPLTGALRAQAIADGLEPAVSYVVIVATVTADAGRAGEAEQRQVTRALHDRVGELCAGALLVERPEEIVGLLAPRGAELPPLLDALKSAVRQLGEKRNVAVAIGMSTRVAGLEEARVGYREARRALSWAQPGPAIVALPFLSTFDYLIASADDTARRMPSPADAVFGDRALAFGPETLHAYFDADLNVRKAAERLGIHANTMHYRLGRISETTGCDLHEFHTLVELLLALRLREPALRAEAGELKAL
jgi:PucR C-terminal helix-turn-helix domain/GGDEF-like domain